MKIVILGSGNWGTTLAITFARLEHGVRLWARTRECADALNSKRENEKYLPGIRIPEEVTIAEKYSEKLCPSDVLIIAVPSSRVREVFLELSERVSVLPTIVSASKGLEYGSFRTMSQVMEEILPNAEVLVLTGPTIAREIAEGQPAKAVLGGRNLAILAKVSRALTNERITFELSNNRVGAELCGALKGIVAIGIGIASGLGLGSNVQGLIFTSGLKEFVEIAQFFSVPQEFIYGLPGLADLATTCLSKNSRNRRLGYFLGKGLSLDEALKEVRMTVEGVNIARTILDLAGLNVPIPLLFYVSETIFFHHGDIAAIRQKLADVLKTTPSRRELTVCKQ